MTTLEGAARSVYKLFAELWRTDARLTAVGVLMLAALGGAFIGIWLDPRTITGAPAWLKPAKFGASTAIYSLTLAWLFRFLPEWRRSRQLVSWVTASVLVLEVAIIDLQAWRGTTSHFNVATPLDATLFSLMGGAIVLQTLTSVAIAIALWRQRFADRALGCALRLGVTLTIIGASAGGLMTRPTSAQLADARAGLGMAVAGAHTVGAPDGGAGIPGTGWSVAHGDLRVPHFLGLHAMQVLPGLALLLGWIGWPPATRGRVVVTAAVSYWLLFFLLLWQALRGQSIVQPDAATLVALGVWALGTAAAVAIAVRPRAIAGAALVY